MVFPLKKIGPNRYFQNPSPGLIEILGGFLAPRLGENVVLGSVCVSNLHVQVSRNIAKTNLSSFSSILSQWTLSTEPFWTSNWPTRCILPLLVQITRSTNIWWACRTCCSSVFWGAFQTLAITLGFKMIAFLPSCFCVCGNLRGKHFPTLSPLNFPE